MRASRLLCVQKSVRSTFLYPKTTPISGFFNNTFSRRTYTTNQKPPQEEGSSQPLSDIFLNSKVNEERPGIYHKIAAEPFPPDVAKILQAPLDAKEVEITPDGLIYLPEIRYRRILNKAFGPGGWALMPTSPPVQDRTNVFRSYALYCYGRFVSEATGEQVYFAATSSIATASEAAKSNALVRCCKDIGVGSELWDPSFIVEWKKKHAVEVWCENLKDHTKKKLWRRQDRPSFGWPYKEVKVESSTPAVPKLPLEAAFDPLSHQIYEDAASAPYYEEEQAAPQQPKRAPPQAKAAPKPQQQQQQAPPQQQFQQQQPPAQSQPKKSAQESAEIDLDEVPNLMKTQDGMTWRQILSDAKAMKGIYWAVKNMQGPNQQKALAFKEWVDSKGGAENILKAK